MLNENMLNSSFESLKESNIILLRKYPLSEKEFQRDVSTHAICEQF